MQPGTRGNLSNGEDKSSTDINSKPQRQRNTKLEQSVDSFYSSIKSRMLVAEVINRIRSGAEFTFDYIALVFLASTIAFFGLLENSSVVLVASMLVSPIMGPILAGTFGAVISDRPLMKRGIYIELLSLGSCIILGFFHLGLQVLVFFAFGFTSFGYIFCLRIYSYHHVLEEGC